MLFRKLMTLAPEGEVGGGETGDTGGTPPRAPALNETPVDGPGSGRGKIRQQLEDSAKQERTGREAREAKETPVKKPAPKRTINHQDASEDEEAALLDAEEVRTAVGEGEEPAEGEPEVKEVAPEGFSKEAKAEWAKTPATVRADILKRISDMDKGVAQIKQRYEDLDKVLAPRMQIMRQNGHTPAAAVNQMFAWFDALNGNPDQAFPALAQSFKYDLRRAFGGAKAPAEGEGEDDGQPKIDPALAQFIQQQIGGLKTEFGGALQTYEQRFQQQNMAKTEEILGSWSRDKPHFEEVREMMAHLIGSGAVPVMANGMADLDAAYDRAVYAVPEVRAKVLEEQKQARIKALKEKREKEAAAQKEQAEKSRRAGSSLAGGSPGDPPAKDGKKKHKSVRESLIEAREELQS